MDRGDLVGFVLALLSVFHWKAGGFAGVTLRNF